jgi:predicted nucleic acid-binding protein
MRRVFADSLYWIALSHRRDQWHSAALALSQALRHTQIVTTDEVLNEFLTALRHTPQLRRTAALQADGVFADPSITVLPQTRQRFQEGFALYKARPDKAYSLTDRISMEAMRQEAITDILTHDSHFTQEGFTILL